MARKLICRWCGNKSEIEFMEKVTKGKTNKYYHKEECYEAYLKEEEFKVEEALKRDSLYQKVMDIYDVKALPTSYYMQIEDLRHGNRIFKNQKIGKRYREGYDYDLIEETYDESRSAIEWSLKNKAFVNLSNMLNYGLSIVINKIYEVEITADAFDGSHFTNPKYTVVVDGEEISFKLNDGKACVMMSTQLIFSILGSYLH